MRKLIATTHIILTISLALSLCGCTGSSSSQPAAKVEAEATKAAGQPTTDAASNAAMTSSSTTTVTSNNPDDVFVSLVSFDQLQQKIASFKDRVVVVDAWSTSCLPCMKEFPHLVELARRWPEDVVCISVNLDFAGLPNTKPSDYSEGVLKFLKSKAANPPNLVNLISTDVDEQMYAKFEIESIPSIFVYDRTGALAGKLTVDTAGADGLTYAGDVVPLVEKLIEK